LHIPHPPALAAPLSEPAFGTYFAALLCRAGLEYLRCSGQQPHILHLHEWQTCAAALLYWEVYSALGLYRPRVVLTIHNLDNTGECRQDEFAYTGAGDVRYGTCCVLDFALKCVMLLQLHVVLTIHNVDNRQALLKNSLSCRQQKRPATCASDQPACLLNSAAPCLHLLTPSGIDGEQFATIERALDERTIGHNPERLNLMKVREV
jgi:hypothetical protein